MDMRCPDGIGRDSWVRVESPFGRLAGALPPIGEEALAECVLLAGGSGSAPMRVVVVVLLLLLVVVEYELHCNNYCWGGGVLGNSILSSVLHYISDRTLLFFGKDVSR